MPTISVDTFFACSLMVILVLTAMANTSKILSPYINNFDAENLRQKYKQIAEYVLLNPGSPANWGENASVIPEIFGLAKADFADFYDLDVDKVSRLNIENMYSLSYSQVFEALGMSEVSFRVEIKPIFDVYVNLTAIYLAESETTYQFEILTEKNNVSVNAELKLYVIAQNYVDTSYVASSNGETNLNVTLSNSVEGPALLVVFARANYNTKVVSFGAYAFAHNSFEPKPDGTFLRLSPLNQSLTVSQRYPESNISKVCALTFNHYSALAQTSSGNQSATYNMPQLADASPIILTVSGWNQTTFFTEWTVYPHLPIQFGADLNYDTLSEFFAFTYTVSVSSALYEFRFWLGGPSS